MGIITMEAVVVVELVLEVLREVLLLAGLEENPLYKVLVMEIH